MYVDQSSYVFKSSGLFLLQSFLCFYFSCQLLTPALLSSSTTSSTQFDVGLPLLLRPPDLHSNNNFFSQPPYMSQPL